jgi:hypothetical protein
MIRARVVPAGVLDALQKNIREGIVSATWPAAQQRIVNRRRQRNCSKTLTSASCAP